VSGLHSAPTAAFLHGKGQILWDVTVDNSYVQPMNFLAPGSIDMFDANNKAVESIDALFQRFTVAVNNMRANVDVLPYDDHDRAVKLLHSLDRTI
jgi:hypothetical protein